MQMEQMSTEEAERLLENYQRTRSQDIRNALVEVYLPIVRSAAIQMRSMAGNLLEQEDLISQGVLALMECLERYDAARGARFGTYAFMRVRGAMIDYIRSQDWVPHRARSFQKKVDEASSVLANRNMRTPDAAEVAEYLELPVEKVEAHYRYMNHAALLSFETVLQDMAVIAAQKEPEAGSLDMQPEESLLYQDMMEALTVAIDALGEKERLVVTLYYYEELKYAQIAEVMGVGMSRVSQIHTRAIKKLKTSMEDYMRG